MSSRPNSNVKMKEISRARFSNTHAGSYQILNGIIHREAFAVLHIFGCLKRTQWPGLLSHIKARTWLYALQSKLRKTSSKKSVWLICEQHFIPQQHLALCMSLVYRVTGHFSPASLHQAEDSKQVHPKISLSRKCHCSNSTPHYSGIPSQTEEKSSTPKANHIPLFTLSSSHRATASIRTAKQTVWVLKQEHNLCKQPYTWASSPASCPWSQKT